MAKINTHTKVNIKDKFIFFFWLATHIPAILNPCTHYMKSPALDLHCTFVTSYPGLVLVLHLKYHKNGSLDSTIYVIQSQQLMI